MWDKLLTSRWSEPKCEISFTWFISMVHDHKPRQIREPFLFRLENWMHQFNNYTNKKYRNSPKRLHHSLIIARNSKQGRIQTVATVARAPVRFSSSDFKPKSKFTKKCLYLRFPSLQTDVFFFSVSIKCFEPISFQERREGGLTRATAPGPEPR